MTVPYPPFQDAIVTTEQEVRWTYWPVSYVGGDCTVISNVPLPLSGVQMSEVMRGVGEFRGTLQLADQEVRDLYPWDKVVPRKTGIVAVREVFEPLAQRWVSMPIQHYVVWAAPRDPETGRMAIQAFTVEYLLARRLITKAITWTGVDQTVIAADLLNPTKFSAIPVGAGLFPGWITINPPTNLTGVPRDFSYSDDQETNLLEAHQKRSQLTTNSYEWTIKPIVLVGADAVSALSFRLVFVLGFPVLGRQLGDLLPVPRFRFDTGGGGNVIEFKTEYDGSDVPNIVWGRGKGYEDLQTKVQVQNVSPSGLNEWDLGALQTEARFSDPDVSVVSTLRAYCYRYMWERLGSEQFISQLKVRGDRPPFLDSYVIGDQAVLETNDQTWPPDYYDQSGYTEFAVRIFGRTLTPPQGDTAETVSLLVSGGPL